MKKKIVVCVVLFIAFSSALYAQQILDKAYLKCSYLFTDESDTLTHENKGEDLLLLQIGHRMSKCYSYYTYQVDSLSALPDYHTVYHKILNDAMKRGDFMKGNFPHKRLKTYIYKNYPTGKMTVTDGISLENFIYEDSLNACQWQIEDSSKVILGYNCQKAICNFRGRQWTAWFAIDVPVSDGPWKLGGLPGLIMEAYDRGKQLYFLINGIQKVNDEPIEFSKSYDKDNKYDKSTRLEFLRAYKRFLLDTSGYIEMETGINLGDGSVKVMRFDLMECDYK